MLLAHQRQNPLLWFSERPSLSTGKGLAVHDWLSVMGFFPFWPRATPQNHFGTFCPFPTTHPEPLPRLTPWKKMQRARLTGQFGHSGEALSPNSISCVLFFSLLYSARAESWVKKMELIYPLAHIHRAGAPLPSCGALEGHPWRSHILLPGLSKPPGAGMPKQYLGQGAFLVPPQYAGCLQQEAAHATQSKAGIWEAGEHTTGVTGWRELYPQRESSDREEKETQADPWGGALDTVLLT